MSNLKPLDKAVLFREHADSSMPLEGPYLSMMRTYQVLAYAKKNHWPRNTVVGIPWAGPEGVFQIKGEDVQLWEQAIREVLAHKETFHIYNPFDGDALPIKYEVEPVDFEEEHPHA